MKQFSVFFVLIAATLMFPVSRASAQDSGKHLFVLSGQSNMRKPLPEAFRECVERAFGGDKIIVATVAKPSQPIKRWFKEWKPPAGMEDENAEQNGTLYDELLRSVERVVKDQRISSVTYIWMQGEADAKSGWGSVYESSFFGVLDQLKRDLDVEKVNFVVGRINDHWTNEEEFPDGELIRSIQVKLGEENANGAWIDTDDLNRGVNPWGGYSFNDGHFPPPGYRVMGQRFARKAILLIHPDLSATIDDLIDEETIFEKASDVKSHAAIGAAVNGAAPEAKYSGGGKGLAVLTDGSFGRLELEDPAWIGFAPSEDLIELVIDLGSAKEIHSVAVNTLISTEAKAEFPDQLVFSTSEDGKDFKINNSRYNTIKFSNRRELGRMRNEGITPQSLLLLTDQSKSRARFIKVQIQTGKQWLFLDEVIVNPEA